MSRSFILLALGTFSMLSAGCGKNERAPKRKATSTPLLICHIGGTMRPVIAKLAEKYTKKTGVEIEIESGGSGELLAAIELRKEGDIYVCHDPFVDILMRKGLGVDAWCVAQLYPVIITRKGNPKHIAGLKDLTRKDVELYLTDYKLSTLGRMMKTIFEKAGIDFEKLNKTKQINTNKSGGYVANIVKTGNADAGIVWNAVAYLRRDSLDVVQINDYLPIPNVDFVTSATGKSYSLTPVRVSVATLKCSKNKTEAAKFAEFLASPESKRTFATYGYNVDPKLIGKIYNDGEAVRR